MRYAIPLGFLAALFLGTVGDASDVAAVYARVDKVVLAPADAPETIQIWGVFSIAQSPAPRTYAPGGDYQPAARGYLYFRIVGNSTAIRREWTDLKQVAHTGQLVAFGARYQMHIRLRPPDEPPTDPDPYPENIGVTKVRGGTDYPPINGLLSFRD